MARQREKGSEQLPPYVMVRKGRFYFEPKGILREKFGGKASYPLGGSFAEMLPKYYKLTGAFVGNDEKKYTLELLVNEYLNNVSLGQKASSTHETDIKSAKVILRVFAEFEPHEIEKRHIYQFQKRRRCELLERYGKFYEKKVLEKYHNCPEELVVDNPIQYNTCQIGPSTKRCLFSRDFWIMPLKLV